MTKEEYQNNSWRNILKGMLYSNLFALAAFACAYTITNWNNEVGGVFTFAEFILVPIGMGVIAMRSWIRITEKLSRLVWPMIINVLIAIALSAIFMREGAICLLIVSPLVMAFMWCGLFLGKYIFVNDNTTLKTSTVVVFIALFVFDTLSVHQYKNMVSDEIVINAPKEVVWKYVAQHPVNTTESSYWLFNIGLPCPVQSTITADEVGAERKCIFSNGATFDEVIVENAKDSVFTFDVVRQPADPEIIGHINIERGQFILKENVDGTTTLIGNSWYTLKVYPVWYYDLWAIDITRNVHIRVMEHIKRLAEKDV